MHFHLFKFCFYISLMISMGFPRGAAVKNTPANAGDTRDESLIPLVSGKSRGQRSLVGYKPWDLKESDTTKHTHTVQCGTRSSNA